VLLRAGDIVVKAPAGACAARRHKKTAGAAGGLVGFAALCFQSRACLSSRRWAENQKYAKK
jgi:hypothetical protein